MGFPYVNPWNSIFILPQRPEKPLTQHTADKRHPGSTRNEIPCAWVNDVDISYPELVVDGSIAPE